MKIQCLKDGLANQILHYIFYRYLERQYPKESIIFDDSYFFLDYVPHNGYELEKVFGIKPKLLSNYFDAETWKEIIRQRRKHICLPQIFLKNGISMVLVEEGYELRSFDGYVVSNCSNSGEFHPELADLPYRNVYYLCTWGESGWFTCYKDENRSELTFRDLTEASNLRYADMIHNSFSVGIHVRRGDFVDFGWLVLPESYKKGCEKALDMYPDAHFFVFSDDLAWCKSHEEELGFRLPTKTEYISGNTGKQSYRDMQLLSMCRGIVRNDRSTFSRVAGWLNPELTFEIAVKRS